MAKNLSKGRRRDEVYKSPLAEYEQLFSYSVFETANIQGVRGTHYHGTFTLHYAAERVHVPFCTFVECVFLFRVQAHIRDFSCVIVVFLTASDSKVDVSG